MTSKGGVHLSADWGVLVGQLSEASAQMPAIADEAALKMAVAIKKEIQSLILEGGDSSFTSRHPLTVDKRGPGSSLFDSGEMYDNLKVTKLKSGTYAIGWDNPKDAQKVLSNEFGAMIPVTPALRAWFAGQGYPLKGSTRYIRIPERPFVRPAAENVLESGDFEKIAGGHFVLVFGR